MTLAEVNKMVMLSIGVADAAYSKTIDSAIEIMWANIADQTDWTFLRVSDPYEVVLIANQAKYKLDKSNIGMLLYLANDEGYPSYAYKDWWDYLLYRKSLGNSYTGTPSMFELCGEVSGKKQIRLLQVPTAAATLHLYYNEAGHKGNITRLPTGAIGTLIHGVKSILAQPKMIKSEQRWQAVTYHEHQMYEAGLQQMREIYASPMPFYRQSMEIDDATDVHMAEAEDF